MLTCQPLWYQTTNSIIRSHLHQLYIQERELKKSSSSRSKKKRRRRRRRSSSSSSSDDNNRDLWRMFYHLNNFDDRRNDYDCDNVDYWGRCIDRRNNDWGDDWNRFFRRSHRSGTRRRGRNSSSSSKSNK